jgi:tRNA dimethylallyltransferase
VRGELFGVVQPGGDVSLATWLTKARNVMQRLEVEDTGAVLVGGTGLFVTGFSEGYQLEEAPIDQERREQLNRLSSTPEGLAAMRADLLARNPSLAATVDMANPRRVIRAVEKIESGIQVETPRREMPDCLVITVDAERELHRQLIESRAQSMFADDALIEEARANLTNGVSAEALRRCGIGYPEALEVIAGDLTRTQARETVIKRTVAYANVQRTWFRHHRVDHVVFRTQETMEPVIAEVGQLWKDFTS